MKQADQFVLGGHTHELADASFIVIKEKLTKILPPTVDIQHVGATAVPGCLTKGDLDICVRVKTEELSACDVILARHFNRNTDSERNESFSSFKNDQANPPLGIQLVVAGSILDTFIVFRDLLRTKPQLLERYNRLKISYDGQPMQNYRQAKSDLVTEILSTNKR